jgi:hypothetical protein
MLLPVFALMMACGSGIDIRVQNATVDLTSKAVPTSTVLDCLAEKLEIKIVYLDGDPPSRPLNLNLKGQTVRQTIEQVLLESQLNYALGADPKSSTGIKTIVITGKKGPANSAPAQPTPYMDPYAGQEMAPEAVSTPEPSEPGPVPYPGLPGNPAGGTPVPGMPGQYVSPTYPGAPGYSATPMPGAPGMPGGVPQAPMPGMATPYPTVAPGYPTAAPGYPTPVPGANPSVPGYPGAPTAAPGYTPPPTGVSTPPPGYPQPPSVSSGGYPLPPSASGTR